MSQKTSKGDNKKIAFRIFQMITKFMYGAKETQVGEVFT